MVSIQKIQMPVPGIEQLQSEARQEGYKYIDTLIQEWDSAKTRFDGPGETLYGCLDLDLLVGVGALSCDPFAGGPDMGRIRKVYLRPAWRNQGVGRTLVSTLVEQARSHFSCVRLRAENEGAARLYERLGFAPTSSPDASHILHF
jgi:GNAT superfamily N-acetyltransferase